MLAPIPAQALGRLTSCHARDEIVSRPGLITYIYCRVAPGMTSRRARDDIMSRQAWRRVTPTSLDVAPRMTSCHARDTPLPWPPLISNRFNHLDLRRNAVDLLRCKTDVDHYSVNIYVAVIEELISGTASLLFQLNAGGGLLPLGLLPLGLLAAAAWWFAAAAW